MEAVLFFILVATFASVAASQKQSNISLTSTLTPLNNSSWLSPSGLYAFGFVPKGDGYIVGVFIAGIPEKTAVWLANRDSPPVSHNATLRFDSDGRLILHSTQTQDTTIAIPTGSVSYASMLDSGNFVIYNSSGGKIWQSFNTPTNTLLAGQCLLPEKELFSSVSETDPSTGIFRLKMHEDGELVQYPIDAPDWSYSYWDSDTYRLQNNLSFCLDNGGTLFLLNTAGEYVKNFTEGGIFEEAHIVFVRLDADGLLRLYSYNLTANRGSSILWLSSNNSCDPRGICGINAFCVNNDQTATCTCLPEFEAVSQGNWTLGCERNFTLQNCKSSQENISFTMQPVPNTEWEESNYSSLSFLTSEQCQTACLQDCNCEVVSFKDGTCKKQRLPLRYGRRNLLNSNRVFVKVGRGDGTSGILQTRGRGDGTSGILQTRKGNKEIRMDILAISVSIGACGLLMILVFAVLIYRNRIWAYKTIPENGNIETIKDIAPRSFTFDELKRVTNDFAEEIGRGAFGRVYKGKLPDCLGTVAIKKLEGLSSDGEREFQNEVKIIGRTHHRNLVCLIGYCLEGSHRLLVYEFMSNGSLAGVLFTMEKHRDWEEKMRIARNIARGLVYLHEECEKQIIHCDIKPQNILIDECRCAKISDFGLSKSLKKDQTNTMTAMRGTKGYVAPEWYKKMPITVKADVYSFGIVLMEIICSRRCVNWELPEEECVLEEWVYKCFEAGKLDKLVNYEHNLVDERQLERMVKVGLWCTLEDPSLRPSMRKVLLMLEGTVDIPTPPPPTSFLSSMVAA